MLNSKRLAVGRIPVRSSCSVKFCDICRKSPVPESFKKVAGLQSTTLLRKYSHSKFFSSNFSRFFHNNFKRSPNTCFFSSFSAVFKPLHLNLVTCRRRRMKLFYRKTALSNFVNFTLTKNRPASLLK